MQNASIKPSTKAPIPELWLPRLFVGRRFSFNKLALRTKRHDLLRVPKEGTRPYKNHAIIDQKALLHRLATEDKHRALLKEATTPKYSPEDVPMENHAPTPAPVEEPDAATFGEAFVQKFNGEKCAGDVFHPMSGELLIPANRKITKMFIKRLNLAFARALDIEAKPAMKEYLTCDDSNLYRSLESLWDTYVLKHAAAQVIEVDERKDKVKPARRKKA